jgi:hypothetical protein
MKNPLHDELIIISLTDLRRIVWKSKGKIFIGALLSALAVMYITLTKPVTYNIHGTFQEKTSQSAGGSITDLLQGHIGGGEVNSAILILTRQRLTPLIDKLGLQATVQEITPSSNTLKKIKENFGIISASFTKKDKTQLSVADINHSLKCNDIKFQEEFPLTLSLKFDTNNTFFLSTPDKINFLHGSLNKPVIGDNFCFTLSPLNDQDLRSRKFIISLSPLASVAEALSHAISITSDKESPGILEFTINHRDRHYATDLVNNMMWEHQAFLKNENDRKVNEQLSYLKRRKNETSDELELVMQDHKNFLVNNTGCGGFADLGSESSFLANSHKEWKNQLVNLNLELQLLEDGGSSPLNLSQDNYFKNEKDENDELQILIKRIRDLSLQKNIVQAQLDDVNIPNNQEKHLALKKINHRLSILEQRMNTYLSTRKGSVNFHKSLIQNQVDHIQADISTLPSKWLLEQKTQMRLEMGQNIVTKVTELVESTIISHNLSKIESRPMDLAIPPTIPNQPKLFLFLAIGCAFGSCFTTTALVITAFLKGIPVSKESLEVANLKVAPHLSSKTNCSRVSEADKQDIESLRQLIALTSLSGSCNNKLLFVLGDGPNYTRLFAELLYKQGKNTLILQCPSDTPQQPRDEGLLQYLESVNSYPVIYKQENGYDLIPSGGSSPFSVELINSQNFNDLLQDLEKQYDTILITCVDKANSPTAQRLHTISDKAIVSLSDEKLSDLKFYTSATEESKENHKSIFLLTS